MVVTIVTFVSLGFWQLRRLDEKRTFNDAVAAGIEGTPIDYATAGSEPYVRVRATGVYDPSGESLVLRSRGGVSGHHVLTPFIAEGGGALLVDRGWVPITIDEPRSGEAPIPQGPVSVEGVLWPAQVGGSGGPRAVVPRIDPVLFDPALQLDPARYLVLLEQVPVSAEYPIAEAPPPLSEGPHLGYAMQWFLFAGVVVVGYPILLRRRAGARRP